MISVCFLTFLEEFGEEALWLTLVETMPAVLLLLLLSPPVPVAAPAPEKAERTCGEVELTALLLVALLLLLLLIYPGDLLVLRLMAVGKGRGKA